jgi:hypothetical protein
VKKRTRKKEREKENEKSRGMPAFAPWRIGTICVRAPRGKIV